MTKKNTKMSDKMLSHFIFFIFIFPGPLWRGAWDYHNASNIPEKRSHCFQDPLNFFYIAQTVQELW